MKEIALTARNKKMAPMAPAFVSIVNMGTPSASRSRDTGLPNRSEFRARVEPRVAGRSSRLVFSAAAGGFTAGFFVS
ncbi:hypothetical protein D4R89_10945 [bacterium]|nr:MAG: hypothetical protein D4R89_10945 [bacterium]